MTLYATLDDVIRNANTPQNTAPGTAEKADILTFLRVISRRIDLEFVSKRPVFAPYTETRRFDLTAGRVNSGLGTFAFDGALLALTSVNVSGTAVSAVEGYPDSTMPPFRELRLTDCCTGWYGYCPADCVVPYVRITGVWGYHRDYASAFPALDALAANINSSQTTFTVADIDGEDEFGVTPRISAGSQVKIGDELIEVIATNTGNNQATGRRGVNGSVASSHSAGDAVRVWQVEEPIRQVVARQAAFILKRRGAYTTMESDGLNSVRYPPDLLPDLRAVLQEYAYEVM